MRQSTGADRPRRSRPRIAALAATVTAGLLVGACGPATSPAKGAGTASAPAASASPTSTEPEVAVRGGSGAVPYSTPVTLGVTNGSFTSVQVTAADGTALEGDVSADNSSWVSQEAPRPGTTYAVSAAVTDSGGRARTASSTFTVATVPNDQRLSFSVTPDDGTTVGIGQPIVVRFTTPVSRRAELEKVMTVTARTSSGDGVEGSWHWLSGSEVHWRPRDFWTPGTRVTLEMKIAGVQASTSRWGRRDYSQTFTVGSARVTKVDSVAHTAKLYRDGQLVATWPAGTGRHGLETYSGTYVVLGKAAEIRMDSCSARITCDKKDPDYYDEKEYWATRITASGTFLHAAGWDGQLGRANVSHGCVHLSDADAKTYYQQAVIGDVVVVANTGRGPAERIATQDPGLIDWNLSWSTWKAGSALH